ncbi:PAS domain-containing protein, partial [Christensenellaceae bacterium OttesenSCG-928-M15]|nr:PAS domain-containing protein [Christensenellaceae bacterium OttesenSCG-928-M15]
MDQSHTLKKMMHMARAGYWEYFPRQGRIRLYPELLALIGIDAAEAPATIDDCEKWIHPDDWPLFVKRTDTLAKGEDRICEASYRILHRDGGIRWVVERSFVLLKDESGRVQAIGAMLYDNTTIKVQEKKSQSQLLEIINNVSSNLTRSNPESFDDLVRESLGAVARAVGADRIYIWENYAQNNRLMCRQTHEWSEHAASMQDKDFALFMDYEDVPFWRDSLLSNRAVNALVKDLPSEERAVLEPQGVLSVLVIPIFFDGSLWGFIGFDNCHSLRSFSKM